MKLTAFKAIEATANADIFECVVSLLVVVGVSDVEVVVAVDVVGVSWVVGVVGEILLESQELSHGELNSQQQFVCLL